MVLRGRLVLGLHTLMTLLSPQEVGAIKADHMGSYGPAFYQSYDGAERAGQYRDDQSASGGLGGALQRHQSPQRVTSPEPPLPSEGEYQEAPLNPSLMRPQLEAAPVGFKACFFLVPPRVAVLPKSRVQLGEPNVLICIVDNIFPPVINVTWLRNGQPITQGVTQTSFYAQPDHSFRKFHYLTFVPLADDFYDCKVEHWGLDQPLFQHWEPQVPTVLPDTTGTLVCALGLILGLGGFLGGITLIITGTCLSSAPR